MFEYVLCNSNTSLRLKLMDILDDILPKHCLLLSNPKVLYSAVESHLTDPDWSFSHHEHLIKLTKD